MNLRSLSIRVRLTLYSAMIFLALCAILSMVVFFFVRARLTSVAQSRLDGVYETIEAVVENSGGDVYDVYHFGHEMLFQLSHDSEVVYQTRTWEEAGLPDPRSAASYNPRGTTTPANGHHFILRVGLVPEYGFQLAVAQDTALFDESARRLAILLLFSLPLVLILSGAGGYLLSGRLLAPVSRITEKAREISAERLSERLPVSNPDDELGRLAAVFNTTLTRLEGSFEQLRRFSSDASHELRTPLSSLRSVGESALRRGDGEHAYREAIGSMLEECDRLTRLSDSLLTLARGDSGKVGAGRRPVDFVGTVGEIVEELRILAEEKGQSLEFRVGPSSEKAADTAGSGTAGIIVVADAGMLEQAVSNVLHNAIRYTPAGGSISVVVGKTTGGEAVIDVIDSGPGIPPEERDRVFDRFYRLDASRTSSKGGIGLGLSIARRAVEMNGGSIEFLHTPSPGSHCRISLPYKQ